MIVRYRVVQVVALLRRPVALSHELWNVGTLHAVVRRFDLAVL